MGRQTVDQSQLFYLFNLEGRIPVRHLLRRINSIAGGGLTSYGPMSSTSIDARPATSIASSRARSPPICRCRRRPSTSW